MWQAGKKILLQYLQKGITQLSYFNLKLKISYSPFTYDSKIGQCSSIWPESQNIEFF